MPEVGSLVWAKLASYPFWPGRVTRVKDVKEKDIREQLGVPVPGSELIWFFGSKNYAWVADNMIVSYDDGYEEKAKNKRAKAMKGFPQALKEAEAWKDEPHGGSDGSDSDNKRKSSESKRSKSEDKKDYDKKEESRKKKDDDSSKKRDDKYRDDDKKKRDDKRDSDDRKKRRESDSKKRDDKKKDDRRYSEPMRERRREEEKTIKEKKGFF